MQALRLSLTALTLFAAACSREPAPGGHDASAAPEAAWAPLTAEAARDPFTYSNYEDVRVTHLTLDLAADFEAKELSGWAELRFRRIDPAADTLVLDSNSLLIDSVETHADDEWRTAAFTLGPRDDVLGSKLEIKLPAGADKVRVVYKTSPDAEGLQWLSPEQTWDKTNPYLLTQFQPFFARTMVPVQDTPSVRITYNARIKTPPELIAVMGAEQDPDGVRDGDYSFEMKQPIPAYLIALAIGDIRHKAITDKIGVYADANMIDRAAKEFEDMPKMMAFMESLYGPYRWGRYDVLVLPPSFPFGGMENPRLTFLTPTLVAGDKSLVNTVAHEFAHGWAGNLVTNATWREVWLNEGFDVYLENRIMEALYGEERAVMERALERKNLLAAIMEAPAPSHTQLKFPADISHPDDAFTDISYSGGMFFLKFLEERFGRAELDAFLKSYFERFAFESVTTEDFLTYFAQTLWAKNPDAVTKEEIDAWVFEPGFPETIERPSPEAFEHAGEQLDAWVAGGDVSRLQTEGWTTHEWMYFLRSIPDSVSADQFAALDARYNLTESHNAEVAAIWFEKSVIAGYEPAMRCLDHFLMTVGRGKFIYPLYQTLVDHGRLDWAEEVYERARPGYHPIAQRNIDTIFAAKG